MAQSSSSSARIMSQNKNIEKLVKGTTFTITSKTDNHKKYTISMVDNTIKCTCPYNVYRKFVCKHITDLTGIEGVLKNNNKKKVEEETDEEEEEESDEEESDEEESDEEESDDDDEMTSEESDDEEITSEESEKEKVTTKCRTKFTSAPKCNPNCPPNCDSEFAPQFNILEFTKQNSYKIVNKTKRNKSIHNKTHKKRNI